MITTLRSRKHYAMMTVLRASRKEAGLTQDQLSKDLKRAQSYIAKIENGERKCSVPELFEIAEAMGTDAVTLISRMTMW